MSTPPGNLDYNIPVTPMTRWAISPIPWNYMSGELSKSGEYQHKFVANVSHDFRSPLTSIKGFVEAIMGRNDPAGDAGSLPENRR